MEPDQVNVVTLTVFRDFEQIDYPQEAGRSRQGRGDIHEAHGLDGIDFDVTLFHGIAGAHGDAGTNPDSNAARDLSATNTLAKALGK